METQEISRQYLETLSTADLINLADEAGIDIPDDLNRYFIIGELLLAYQPTESEDEDQLKDIEELDEEISEESQELPKTYNQTTIDALMRNPEWIFVYWDIKESTILEYKSGHNFEGLLLHVSFYEYADDEKPESSYDINISLKEKEQYVLIPRGKKYVSISLVAQFDDQKADVLAFTKMLELPQMNPDLVDYQPGKKIKCPALVQMSDFNNILNNHYLNHH